MNPTILLATLYVPPEGLRDGSREDYESFESLRVLRTVAREETRLPCLLLGGSSGSPSQSSLLQSCGTHPSSVPVLRGPRRGWGIWAKGIRPLCSTRSRRAQD